jgi:hypothetical protein
VKNRRADKVATKMPELRFEVGVIRANQAGGSPGRRSQVTPPGGKDQLGLMLLLDAGSSRVAVTVVKVKRDSEIPGPVLDQLDRR